MERSPLLSIYFLLNSMIYLLSYPIVLQFNWFKNNMNSLFLKCILIPVRGSYTYIYLLKSMRLSWGFRNNSNKKPTTSTKLISILLRHEWLLLIFCVILFLLNAASSILASDGQYTSYDFSSTDDS